MSERDHIYVHMTIRAGVAVGGCACVIGISSESGVGFGAGGGVAGELLIISTT